MDSYRQQQQYQRPLYPHVSSDSPPPSTPSSVFQSSTSISSVASYNTAAASATYLPAAMPPHSAPLPSPLPNSQSTYFATASSQSSQPLQAQTAEQASNPQQQQQQPQFLQAPSTHQQARTAPSTSSGGPSGTTAFLQDFNLVAEAAKRAQMACLVRDLGDVGL